MPCNCDCKKCRAIHDGCDCFDMKNNTDFYCCDDIERFLNREGFTLKEYIEIEDAKYCHLCGKRLSSLV